MNDSIIYLFSINSKNSLKVVTGFEVYLFIVSIYLFFYGPESALWNGRIVPFFNLSIIILFFNLLQYDIKNLTKKIQGKFPLTIFILFINSYFMYLYYSKWGNTYSTTTISVILIVLFMFFISINSQKLLIYTTLVSLTFGTLSYLPHWLNWNFSGYESKNNWSDIVTLYEGLNTLEPGRIMWEPNSDLNKYGTPMVLMTIPMFTDHQSVEGLYFDSSITTPFHFLTVSGVAERPSNPVGGLTYINGEFDKGMKLIDEELGGTKVCCGEEDSESDSLAVSKIVQENAENTEVANVNDTAIDSLTIKIDKSPPKIKKKKTIISKVSLSINTIPEKVDVFLDGSLIGKTPISGQKILSGGRIFEIRKDGFAPISYELNVNPSKSVNLDFFMNPIYNVKFKTDEVGLIFELNDVHRWTEDAIRMQLEAGDHQLRVYKLGEIVDEQIIVADQPLTFQYYLKRGVVIKP